MFINRFCSFYEPPRRGCDRLIPLEHEAFDLAILPHPPPREVGGLSFPSTLLAFPSIRPGIGPIIPHFVHTMRGPNEDT
jgi:hypothetical protein